MDVCMEHKVHPYQRLAPSRGLLNDAGVSHERPITSHLCGPLSDHTMNAATDDNACLTRNARQRRHALGRLTGLAGGLMCAAIGVRAHGPGDTHSHHRPVPAPPAVDSAPPHADGNEASVREWLRQNPGRAKAMLEEASNPGPEAFARYRTEIESARGGFAVGGGRSPKVVVVDFFDYHCPACKRASYDLVALMRVHPDVRFVFKETPILREDSKVPAVAALSVRPLGRYLDFHLALMAMPGLLTSERVIATAQRLGIAPGVLHAAWGDSAIADELRDNLLLANRLGVRSAPLLVVNGQALEGRNPQELERLIAAARTSEKGQAS
jgi:protein-disulfide isomerase